MITLRPGSHARNLVLLLSVAGEFPVKSLHLLGSERVIKQLVHKMQMIQEYRVPETEIRLNCKLIQINGKGAQKSIRLHKSALAILRCLNPKALDYYMRSFWGHKFPGDMAHRNRNHRVAEAVAVMMQVSIEVRPYLLPVLQNEKIVRRLLTAPVFYLARDLKKLGDAEMNKTMFSRMVGALFCPDAVYAVYNTRNAVMKWNGMGEFKALHYLIEISRMNTGITDIRSAILLGESEDIALKTLLETEKNHRLELRFDSIYENIYFIPMNSFGVQVLSFFHRPGWRKQLLAVLFESDNLSEGRGVFEYDAMIDDVYVFSFFDYNIARLIRLKEAIQSNLKNVEILCYPEQIQLLLDYLGPDIRLKTIELETVKMALEQRGW